VSVGGSSASVDADTAVGIRPGDAIRLRVYRDTSLTGEFSVNENGDAVLPLIGRREVAGLSPNALRSRLLSEYGEYLKDPAIDVTVLRRISILGSVREPGLYPVDPTVSLAEALATAGGITPDGDRGDIRLVRDGRVLRENLDRTTLLGTTSIESGDRIYVDRKPWFQRNWQWIGGTLSTVLIFAFLR
jgi:polysaccharide export outer membrane protein